MTRITKDDVFVRRNGNTIRVMARYNGLLHGVDFVSNEYNERWLARSIDELILDVDFHWDERESLEKGDAAVSVDGC